jgi:predicted glycogen debranching enzyme
MLDLGPGRCADDVASRQHEWLLTNGRGGYACGTVAGTLDRRYHGALVAAVEPPDTRSLLLAKFDERLIGFCEGGQSDQTLTSDVWTNGGLSGFGHRALVRFRVVDGRTEATWLLGRTRLTRRMVMVHGVDAIVAEYTVEHCDEPIELAVKLIGSNRAADFLAPDADFLPSLTQHDAKNIEWALPQTKHGGSNVSLSARLSTGSFTPASEWFRGYHLDTEQDRGYDATDAHIDLGECRATLKAGETLRIDVACGVYEPPVDPFEEEASRIQTPKGTPAFLNVLFRAADQFIVERPIDETRIGSSIVAGYPWFADWGRDTMISIPGLCLVTERADVAQNILTTFSTFLSEGMLPNRFPGRAQPPEYNTADASLLYIDAIGRTYSKTRDDAFLVSILPSIDEILDAYTTGTRHNIGVDRSDGLLSQGAEGLQLTWMDAKVGNTVVTPRRGKAVELNALWYSAWRWRSFFATCLHADSTAFDHRAEEVQQSFGKFSDSKHDYLADVIDGDHGVDFSLRPNQLFATGCSHPPVTGERAAAVLRTCTEALYTPMGIRTLAPSDSRYQGHYGGDVTHRDAAYHMGTSWPWLLGVFVRTHLNVHNDKPTAQKLIAPFVKELERRGLGSISEVHDGDAPFAPGGTIAQAWSVGEILALCLETTEIPNP